ncbi:MULTISPECIES: alpha/beta hydrolase [Cyanophyceae]|uniref:alpha/beta hydrolase n=1 Tax=Cyanophyceae TaxID=3028117 RepID=UPI0016893A76|nr:MULTISPECIES: alpha/beta hydrolase [Cyanophyceae]MBD1918540.1 alpha/beta hydrolase [Phormidium sp. FACHB-77]MBD2031429.1 alpha/beta hydrolase [Phormidium sp. FACHB-322]MBD2049548.1 alpha/beta hydrolase [Leptolyngbya sp. FACHB-60]
MTWQPVGRWLRPRTLALGGLSLGLTVLSGLPVQAAEAIFFSYGPVERSVSTSSLETLIESGELTDDLAFYVNLVGLSEAEVAQLRQNLDRPLEVDGVLLSRFLYTSLGEELLNQVGVILKTRAGGNGKLSLRAALIQAATSPEGLSAINVVRSLPTDMQISINDARAVASAVERIVNATTDSIVQLEQSTVSQAAQQPTLDYANLADLTVPGPARVQIQRFELTDTQRDRQLYMDVVRPRQWRGQAPVMVFSHGLTSRPESRHQWASHLASHGIVVVLPQHPDSDAQQVADFRAGLSNDVFEVQEFIDRPLDITFVLNELERLNPTEFEGRLKLDQVGVGGHSLGGYTALAVAGAELNFDHLQEVCDGDFIYLNMSLLLQCQALELPRETYRFRDPRVNSVLLVNPVNSSVFGPDGLATVNVPVMVIAGSHDPATPAVFEQFRTFSWYTTENRSLALIEGQAHIDVSALDAGLSRLLSNLPGLTLAEPEVIDRYMNALGLAFVGRYVARRPEYGLYLRSGYDSYLSQGEPFRLFMVNAGVEVDQQLNTPLNDRLNPLERPKGE